MTAGVAFRGEVPPHSPILNAAGLALKGCYKCVTVGVYSSRQKSILQRSRPSRATLWGRPGRIIGLQLVRQRVFCEGGGRAGGHDSEG